VLSTTTDLHCNAKPLHHAVIDIGNLQSYLKQARGDDSFSLVDEIVEEVVYPFALPRARKLGAERDPGDVDGHRRCLSHGLPSLINGNVFEEGLRREGNGKRTPIRTNLHGGEELPRPRAFGRPVTESR
jgi:hypothetical protein